MRTQMTLEERLSLLEEGIVKAKMILDGHPTNTLFTPAEYMKFYDCVYFICIQQQSHHHSMHLYQRFERALKESISSRVLPSLQNKSHASLLIELTNMWANYKVMAKCLIGFFLYLDRYDKHDASLSDVSVRCFCDLVCNAHYQKFQDAAIALINQDRSGNPIDKGLLKNVFTFFIEIGRENRYYFDNFEKAILADTASYYSRLASELLVHYSSVDYIKKIEWCLNDEIQRVRQFLHRSTIEKLLQVLKWQLIDQTESKLTEKQKAENDDFAIYQELLSRCASLSLGDGTSASSSQE